MTRIAALLCLAAALALDAPDAPAQARASATDQGVEVELSLDRTDIVVGEPVHLVVRVYNRSASYPIGNFGAKLFFTEGNDVRVMVQSPGELGVRFEGADQAIIYPSVEVDLRMGEQWHEVLPLIHEKRNSNGYVFNKPGRFIVSASLTCTILREATQTRVDLPPTAVTVSPPEGRAAEAFALVSNPDAARAFQLGSTDNEAVLTAVRRVAADFADTPYAPYALYLSGTGAMRAQSPRYEQAIRDLRLFVERHRDHPKAPAALFNIVLCHVGLNDTDTARDWFWYLWDFDRSYALLRKENPTASFFYFRNLEKVSARRWWMLDRPWDTSGLGGTAANAAAPSEALPE